MRVIPVSSHQGIFQGMRVEGDRTLPSYKETQSKIFKVHHHSPSHAIKKLQHNYGEYLFKKCFERVTLYNIRILRTVSYNTNALSLYYAQVICHISLIFTGMFFIF